MDDTPNSVTRKCIVEGCETHTPPSAPWAVICGKHRDRLQRTGTTDPGPKASAPMAERMWRRIDRNAGGCWEWPGGRNQAGYGIISRGRRLGGSRFVHRVAWESERGPIPDGLYVCHHCDNPPCVRPDHLFLGTPLDNARDMVAKGRHPARRNGDGHDAKTYLTVEDRRKIRLLAASGVTVRYMAQIFNAYPSVISQVVDGQLSERTA